MAELLKIHCDSLLRDEELVPHLQQGHLLVFRGLGKQWQDVERQVERLGFGQQYLVSQIGARDCSTKVAPVSRWP